jgi:ABC-type nitrate/sulfonate/bicarbonate transport system substrate-binding protein
MQHMIRTHRRGRPFRLAGAAAALAVAVALSACSTAADAGSTDSATDDVTLQLNWITNSTWAGSYLAQEDGYYSDADLNVNIATGGPNVDFMAALSSGQALMAFAGFTEPATLNQQGGDYVVIGTMYQRSPLAFVSKAGSGISSAKDLEGKKVGIAATSQSVWEQYSATAGIDTSTVTVVPITSGPEALIAGDVDAYLGFSTEAPGQLAAKGVDVDTLLLQDAGYGYYVDVYTVHKADLDDPTKRDQIKRLLKADLEGQLALVSDPDAGAALTMDLYGQTLGLDEASEKSIAEAAVPFFYSPTTEAEGIGYMGGDEMTTAMTTLNSILGTDMPLDGAGYVDMSLLDEIKAEDPSFGKLPAQQ